MTTVATARIQQACAAMRLQDDPFLDAVAKFLADVGADSELRDPHQDGWEQAMRMAGGQYKHALDIADTYLTDPGPVPE